MPTLISEFLRVHQDTAVPVIGWGGMLVLILVILSPFLIIRFRYFRPTHWWHIAGAYGISFVIYFFLLLNTPVNHWFIYNIFNSPELYQAFDAAIFKTFILFVPIYPLLTFYSAKLLYGTFTIKRTALAILLATLLLAILVISLYNLMLYGLGQASINF